MSERGRLTVQASASFTASLSAPAVLSIQPDPAAMPVQASLSVDGSPSAAAQPRGVPAINPGITVGIEVYVGGTLVPLSRMWGAYTVKLTMLQALQEWSFGTSIEGGAGYFGSPFDALGCPFGIARIDLFGVYLTPTGVHRYPLISGGIGDNTKRVGSLTEGFYELHNGFCAGGRFDGELVTLVVPAGSGEQRDQVIRDLFDQLSEPITYALDAMNPVQKELQYVDAAPIGAAQELADVELRRLLWSTTGELVSPRLGARHGYLVVASFDERDFVAAVDPTSLSPQNLITDITLVTSQTVAVPADTAAAGRQATVSVVKAVGAFQIGNATYDQNPDGSLHLLTGGGNIPTTGLRLQTTTTVETQQGVTVAQLTRVESYLWLQIARYTWASGAVSQPISGAWLDGTATAAGQEPAYAEPYARWRVDTESVQTTFWDTDDLCGPDAGLSQPWGAKLAGHFGMGQKRTGLKLGSVTVNRSWYLVRKAVKQATSPPTNWDAIDPIIGRKILGNGEGVGDGAEIFQDVSGSVEVIEADDDGNTQIVTTYSLGFVRPAGSAWWFQGSGPSAVETEFWGVTGTQIQTYASTTANSFQLVTVRLDANGLPVGDTVIELKAGAPPAVDRIQLATDATPKTTNQQIKVQVIAGALEVNHKKRVVKTSLSYPENVDELTDIGVGMIERSAAADIEWATTPNYQLVPGMFVHLLYRPIGLDADVQILELTHTGSSTPLTTRMTTYKGAAYPPLATS